MDRWAGRSTAVGLLEWWLHSSYIQTQRHHQKQAQARLSGLWNRDRLTFSRECSISHVYTHLCCQGDGRRDVAAEGSGEGNGRKQWEAKERGLSADYVTRWFKTFPIFFPTRFSPLVSGWRVERAVGRNESAAGRRARSEPENRDAGEAASADWRWGCMRKQKIHYIQMAFLLNP